MKLPVLAVLIGAVWAAPDAANLQNFASQSPQQLERVIVSLESPYIARLLVNTNGAVLRRSSRPVALQFNEPRLDAAFINYLQRRPFLTVKLDNLGRNKKEFTFEELFSVPYLDDFLESELINGNIDFADTRKTKSQQNKPPNKMRKIVMRMKPMSVAKVQKNTNLVNQNRKKLEVMKKRNATSPFAHHPVNPLIPMKSLDEMFGHQSTKEVVVSNDKNKNSQNISPKIIMATTTAPKNFKNKVQNPLFAPENILPKGSGIEEIYKQYLNSRNFAAKPPNFEDKKTETNHNFRTRSNSKTKKNVEAN